MKGGVGENSTFRPVLWRIRIPLVFRARYKTPSINRHVVYFAKCFSRHVSQFTCFDLGKALANHPFGVIEIWGCNRVSEHSDKDLTNPASTAVGCEMLVFRMRNHDDQVNCPCKSLLPNLPNFHTWYFRPSTADAHSGHQRELIQPINNRETDGCTI